MPLLCSLLFLCAHAQPPAATSAASAASWLSALGGPIGWSESSPIATTTNPVNAAQWHFGGGRNVHSSVDWIYSIVNTDKKETVACGYTKDTNGTYFATIEKIDHYGQLAWSDLFNQANITYTKLDFSSGTLVTSTETDTLHGNDLRQIVKTGDGYYAAIGRGFGGFLLIIVDEYGTCQKGTPVVIVPPNTSTCSPTVTLGTPTRAGGYSIAVDPTTNSANNLIIGGIVAGTSDIYGGILMLDYSGGAWSISGSYYGGPGVSSVNKILTKRTGSSSYAIYGCGTISETTTIGGITQYDSYTQPPANNADPVSVTDLVTYNKDIWVFQTTNSFASVASEHYNKGNIIVNVTGGSGHSDITTYGTSTYPYQEVGPLTARNYDPTTKIVGYLSQYESYSFGVPWFLYNSYASIPLNAINNANEGAYDMTFTRDSSSIAVIGMVNIIGDNPKWDLGFTVSDVITTTGSSGSAAPGFGEYVDGDAFLLKFPIDDFGTTSFIPAAKNVGHFSGTDFWLQIKQDLESHYIITGSSSDYYGTATGSGWGPYTYTPNPDMNLMDISDEPDFGDNIGDENAYIVVTGDDFTAGTLDISRRTFAAYDGRTSGTAIGPEGDSLDEDCSCIFAMDVTADGGFIIAGNNDHNTDDWTVTKFAPLHEELMVRSGHYEQFGNPYIPITHTVSGTETWSASDTIASKVVVPAGATLNITGSGTIISFAASDQLWDYTSAATTFTGITDGCGIFVQAGGTLNITDATLQGISIAGEHNMWDGIVVQGDSDVILTASQGTAVISGGKIKDARYGLYVSDNYRTYGSCNPTTTVTGCFGGNAASFYNGYATKGGGIVTANNDSFINCRFGMNHQNYPAGNNTSSYKNCTFISTATGMGDICFYTDAWGDLFPANTHCSAWAVTGISFTGNTFTCSNTFAPALRPIGIVSSTAGFKICRYYDTYAMTYGAGNTFSNLVAGVYGTFAAGVSPALYIDHNTFDNCEYGALISGQQGTLVVTNNNFLMAGDYPSYTFSPTGVTLAGCSGYDVSQNTFDKCSTCYSTTSWALNAGAVINNGETENELLNLNIFNNVTYASTALGTNGTTSTGSGLQFHCNAYNDLSFSIIRSSQFMYGTVAPCYINSYQGYCSGSANTPAGNQFYAACPYATSQNRIYATDASVVQEVEYRNNDAGSYYDPGTCATYTNPSTILTNTPCSTGPSPSVSSACPTPYTYTWGVGGFADAQGDLATLDALIPLTIDPIVLAGLNADHDYITSFIGRYYALNYHYDSAASLLASYNLYRNALPFYMMAGDYFDAQAMHDAMPMVTHDDSLYAWETQLAINLYSLGNTWMGIDSTSADSMRRLTQYDVASGYMAGGLGTLIGTGYITWPVPLYDSATYDSALNDTAALSPRMANAGNTIQPVGDNTKAIFSIFPNPSYGSLTVNTSISGLFILESMDGKEISKYELMTGSNTIQFPLALSTGIYMGVFKPSDNSKQRITKLIYQP